MGQRTRFLATEPRRKSQQAYSPFTNEGTLRTGDAAGLTFRFTVGSVTNSGLVHSPAGHSLTINSSFSRAENSGTLQVDGNMAMSATAGLYNESAGVIAVAGKLTLNETRLRNRASREDFWERPDRGANDVRASSS